MSKEHLKRVHGDGDTRLELSIKKDEYQQYLEIFQSILSKIDFDSSEDQSIDKVLLALKQRLDLAFSNGCPWPEKVITDFINKQEDKPKNLDQLEELILESGRGDAQCNILYKKILQYANRTLRSELQLLKPVESINGQENDNLPKERTEHNLVAGMAYDPVYFDILVPLKNFIVKAEDQNVAHNQITKFLYTASLESRDIAELIERTKNFLK